MVYFSPIFTHVSLSIVLNDTCDRIAVHPKKLHGN